MIYVDPTLSIIGLERSLLNQFEPIRAYVSGMVPRLDIVDRLQRRIVEIATTALPLIGKSITEADQVGLAHLRGEMITAIAAYVDHVRALEAEGRLPPLKLEVLVSRCTKLDSAYEAFRKRWVHRNGIEHWHEYRLSAAVLMKQIRSLLQSEDDPVNGTRSVTA